MTQVQANSQMPCSTSWYTKYPLAGAISCICCRKCPCRGGILHPWKSAPAAAIFHTCAQVSSRGNILCHGKCPRIGGTLARAITSVAKCPHRGNTLCCGNAFVGTNFLPEEKGQRKIAHEKMILQSQYFTPVERFPDRGDIRSKGFSGMCSMLWSTVT